MAFRADHAECQLGIVDEYGARYSLTGGGTDPSEHVPEVPLLRKIAAAAAATPAGRESGGQLAELLAQYRKHWGTSKPEERG